MFFKLFLIIGYVFIVDAKCTIDNLPQMYSCRARVDCDTRIEDLDSYLKNNWACIKTVISSDNYMYNYYDQRSNVRYATDYVLELNVENIDINDSEDPLLIGNPAKNIQKLALTYGNLVSIPIQINSLTSLIELSITYNEVEAIDLIKLSHLQSLKILNCSHNALTTINIDSKEESRTVSLVTSIDFSHNILEYLPDNCFTPFSNLKYLDLSNNMLSELDILTFEGITHLETLLLSNNKLTEIGQNFARFINLNHFTIDHNLLTSITEHEFRKLVSLKKLNLSSNRIKNIEDRTFVAQVNLEELDLSDNQINYIQKQLFENNLLLSSLLLSNNCIETIEGSTFFNKNISVFDISNNNLNGSIDEFTFQGIYVDNLDLSKEKLTYLDERAFSAIGTTLRFLNLSMNNIYDIADTAFNSLDVLLQLDISYNSLTEVEFDTSDLKSLTEYYLNNNKIKKIEKEFFKSLASLIKLDLSHNFIADIDRNVFLELKNLERLLLFNNPLVNTLEAKLFDGLRNLQILDISNTKIMNFKNESFENLDSIIVNASHSEVETIEYESFKGSGAIKVIDLSYNMLEQFNVNTSHLNTLTEIYLNHNKLRNVTNTTFDKLYALEKINLAFNNIINMDSEAFQTVPLLKHLSLANNVALDVKENTLDNLYLSEVSFNNIKGQLGFKDARNTSITSLEMKLCNISDLNKFNIFNVKKILKLDISFNSITFLDKVTFKEMPLLNWLDLSFNRIAFIQPGTFLFTNMINTLNLHGNNLQSIQFGVLDGLKNLRVLNLSSNAINVFDADLLHSTPLLSHLYLDNNVIKTVDFEKFLQTHVKSLSIGGNLLLCNSLIRMNQMHLNDSFIITAENLDYSLENIHGVTCKTNNKQDLNFTSNVKNLTSNVNLTEVLNDLHEYFNNSKLIPKTLDDIKVDLDSYATMLTEFLNKSQDTNGKFLKSFIEANEKLIHIMGNEISKLSETLKYINETLKTTNEIEHMTNMYLKEQNIVINKKLDIVNAKQEVLPKTNAPQRLDIYDSFNSNISIALYFICACLAIVILLNIISLALKNNCKIFIEKNQNTSLSQYECNLEME